MHQTILRLLLSGLVAAMLLADRIEAQSPGTGTMADHPVDHILLAVPDLASGSADMGEMLLVEPTPGGEHPDLGTANSLVGLGGGIYLEIIGPASRDIRSGFAERLAKLTWPELIGFAVQTGNLEVVRDAAKAAGMTTGEIRAGSRKTPDGTMLQWRTMSVIDTDHDFLMPFFIDWGETPHPSATSVSGPQLISWEVGHPAPEGLQKIYDALGIGITVVTAPKPFLRARIKTADRTIVLLGTGGQ